MAMQSIILLQAKASVPEAQVVLALPRQLPGMSRSCSQLRSEGGWSTISLHIVGTCWNTNESRAINIR